MYPTSKEKKYETKSWIFSAWEHGEKEVSYKKGGLDYGIFFIA